MGTSGATMDFEAYRDEFPIFRTKQYLNTCSLGPLSTRSREAVLRYLADWDELGAHAWYERWIDALDALRGQFARLVGARRKEIALVPNVSSALSVVASALDYQARDTVVTTELDFPTIPYQWAARPGVHVNLLTSPDSITVPLEAFARAVDEQTAAVATCHVFFATGFRQDIQAIARISREAGALSIADGYHAAGQLPVDLPSLGVDVYISGSLKWLLGGPGLAFLYVRRGLHGDLVPTTAGWFGNAHQFDFDPRKFAFRDDAQRFELGTPSKPAAFAASGGLDLIAEVGPVAIQRQTRMLVEDLIDRGEDAGLDLRIPPADHRTGIVMVEHPDPAGAVEHLLAKGLIVDARGSRVRISPYFFNTVEENQAVVDGLGSTV